MSFDEVKKINEQAIAAWDTHDIDAFVSLMAEDIVWNDVSLPSALHGKEAVRQYMHGWITAFPDMRTATKNSVVAEDSVASEIEWHGTHSGPMQGPPGTPAIPPTGKKVVGKGAYFARLRGGKVVEFSAHPDVAGLMMQLGLMGG